MKNVIAIFILTLSLGAYAEPSPLDALSLYSSAITVAPTFLPFQLTGQTVKSISGPVQRRGVAYQEQLRDELVELNDDIIAGKVNTLEGISQPALRELAMEIQNDEEKMKEVSSVVKSESEFVRVVTAIAISIR